MIGDKPRSFSKTQTKENTMAIAVEELLAKIERNKTVTASAVAAFGELKAHLTSTDTSAEDRIAEAVKLLDENTDALAAAIVSGTVAAAEAPAPSEPAAS
jgi:hypothetical protein